jgi:CubicO group peptidase (beta-lactamase class C family)
VGRSIEEELTARFFLPLGMNDTYVLSDPRSAALWTGYIARDGGLEEASTGHAYAADGGAWVSTMHDLTIWAQAFFGGRLHRPETFALAQGTGGGRLLEDVAAAFGLDAGGYGHGLIVAHDGALGSLLAGAGNGDGARTFVGYLPAHGVTFVVAVDIGDGSVPIIETLSAAAPLLAALRETIPE